MRTADMNAAISAAIAGTTQTPTRSPCSPLFANDPPTLADLELLRAKINELLLAARR